MLRFDKENYTVEDVTVLGETIHIAAGIVSGYSDTSLRLAKYFGVSDRYFLDLQNDIDLRELKASIAKEIQDIRPFQSASV